MRKRTIWVTALGLGAILLAGGLFASNMGFKLNYLIPGGGASGQATIALPYNAQIGMSNSLQLKQAIANATGIGYLNRSNNLLVTYTGVVSDPPAFFLVPGEGYTVTVSAPSNYIIVGSDNPGLGINFSSGGASGQNLWSYPYHSTIPNAHLLKANIPNATGIGYLNRSNNLFVTYTGTLSDPPPFFLIPGESYTITVSSNTTGWIPPHY
jgi:archaellum component FlaF (FlaF/FlaG flagellin family)